VFENGVIRRIFGPKMEEVAGGWRRLHNEELHKFYALPNIVRVMKSKRMKWVGHEILMEGKKYVYNILVSKPEGKKILGRSRRTREDNIRMDLR
jgi:hypothetical protein